MINGCEYRNTEGETHVHPDLPLHHFTLCFTLRGSASARAICADQPTVTIERDVREVVRTYPCCRCNVTREKPPSDSSNDSKDSTTSSISCNTARRLFSRGTSGEVGGPVSLSEHEGTHYEGKRTESSPPPPIHLPSSALLALQLGGLSPLGLRLWPPGRGLSWVRISSSGKYKTYRLARGTDVCRLLHRHYSLHQVQVQVRER